MSDTPRTDAAMDTVTNHAGKTWQLVEADFARELERENAKLRGALHSIYTLPVSDRKWSTAMDIAGTALSP